MTVLRSSQVKVIFIYDDYHWHNWQSSPSTYLQDLKSHIEETKKFKAVKIASI